MIEAHLHPPAWRGCGRLRAQLTPGLVSSLYHGAGHLLTLVLSGLMFYLGITPGSVRADPKADWFCYPAYPLQLILLKMNF